MKLSKIKSLLVVVIIVSVSFTVYRFFQSDVINETVKPLPIANTKPIENIEKIETIQFVDNDLPEHLRTNICEKYVLPIEDITVWKDQKAKLIKDIYKNLQDKNTDIKIIDHITKLSGINLISGRMFSHLPNANTNPNLPFLADQNSQLMNEGEQKQFSKLLIEKQYSELYQAFLNGKITLNKYGTISWKVLPQISHIINSDNSQVGQNLVLQLIALGAKPTFIDLLTATQLNLPVSFVSQLYNANEIDASRIFYDNGLYNSLSLVAAKINSPDLLEYWLSLDSPASPDIFMLNALDNISSLKDNSELEETLEMFLLLMDHGVQPNNALTINNLNTWLPEDIKKTYETSYSKLNDNALPETWKPVVYFKVFEIYRAMLQGYLKVDGSDVVTNKCFLSEGNRLVKLALSKNKTTKAKFVMPPSFESDAIALIEASDLENLTLEEVISNLEEKGNVASKIAINKLLNEQVSQKVKLKNDELEKQTSAKQLAALEQAMSAIKDNDWDSVDKVISQLDELESQEQLSLKLVLAISSGQSWEIIHSLLNGGAQIPENAIYLLSQANNPQLAQKLLPFGLNLNVIDATGNNAFNHAVIHNAKEMIVFLISNEVNINPDVRGLDCLDQALALLQYRPSMLSVIDLLIVGGKKIEFSHKERVASFKDSDLDTYKRLVEKFPVLKM